MRGLTPLERRVLAGKAVGVHPPVAEEGTSEWNLLAGLVAAGRTKESVVRLDEDGELVARGIITDLGRLALRVCPVDES